MSAAQAPSAAVSQGLLESAGSFAAGGQAWLGETGGDRPRNGDGWPGASAKIAQPTAPRQDERQVPQGGLLTSLAQEPRQNKPRDPLFPISAEAAKGTGREAGFSGGSARKGQGGILEVMAGYPQWREGYLRNYDRRQQEILNIAAPNPNPSLTYASNEQTAEEQRPRADAMGKRGLVSTNPENPAYPDRGNFAEKLWGRQSQSQDKQVPDLTTDQQATRDTLLKVRTQGKNLGYENSSRMLDHYLNGNGAPVTLDKDWARQHPPIKEGEAKSQKHFEEWLVGKGPPDSQFKTIKEWMPKDNETREIKGMQWDGAVDNPSWRELDDKSNTLGALTVKGEGDLKLERKGNDVFVTGTVNQHGYDKYDFDKKNRNNEWLPQGVLGGDATMTRQQITDMEKAGGAKAFEIKTDPWTKVLEGRLKLDDKGNIIGSQFVWREIPPSDNMRR